MRCPHIQQNKKEENVGKVENGGRERVSQLVSSKSWVQTCMPPYGGSNLHAPLWRFKPACPPYGGSTPSDHLLRQTHTISNTCDLGPIPILLLKHANIVPLPVIVLITSDRRVVFYLFYCVCDCVHLHMHDLENVCMNNRVRPGVQQLSRGRGSVSAFRWKRAFS